MPWSIIATSIISRNLTKTCRGITVIPHLAPASKVQIRGNGIRIQFRSHFPHCSKANIIDSIPFVHANAMRPLRNPKLCLSLHHLLFRFRIKPNSFVAPPPSLKNLNPHLHRSLCTSSSSSSSAPPESDSKDTKTSGHIDAGSSNRKPISLWPGMYHSPATHALWEARSKIFEAPVHGNGKYSDALQPVPKTPSQSRTSIYYNFSSDHILREQYRNPWNHIRMGKLVEDFDALAGTIAFKVCFAFLGN